jgi:PAS domain S-box-containing protein
MNTKAREQQLFRALPVLAALLDRDGRFIDVSDEWVRRTGFGRDEMLGRSPEDIATEATAQRVGFICKDGETIELLATTVAQQDEDGQFLYSISVFVEIAGRARAERRYQDLYHSTPAMLHTVDSQGRITDVSDHWLAKLGYTRADVIGRSILDFMTEESRQPLLDEGIAEVISAGDRQNVPRQMVTRGGEILDVLMSASTELRSPA